MDRLAIKHAGSLNDFIFEVAIRDLKWAKVIESYDIRMDTGDGFSLVKIDQIFITNKFFEVLGQTPGIVCVNIKNDGRTDAGQRVDSFFVKLVEKLMGKCEAYLEFSCFRDKVPRHRHQGGDRRSWLFLVGRQKIPRTP